MKTKKIEAKEGDGKEWSGYLKSEYLSFFSRTNLKAS